MQSYCITKRKLTQWRTIAPIVRPAAIQCSERYQKLLDDAKAKENKDFAPGGAEREESPSANDICRLRLGEIGPHLNEDGMYFMSELSGLVL